MNPITISPSVLLNLFLGVLLVALLLALVTRNPAPPTTVVVNPEPEYLRRSPGASMLLSLAGAVFVLYVLATVLGQ